MLNKMWNCAFLYATHVVAITSHNNCEYTPEFYAVRGYFRNWMTEKENENQWNFVVAWWIYICTDTIFIQSKTGTNSCNYYQINSNRSHTISLSLSPSPSSQHTHVMLKSSMNGNFSLNSLNLICAVRETIDYTHSDNLFGWNSISSEITRNRNGTT